MPEPLLSVSNLETQFFTDDGVVRAVDDVSFSIAPREILGVVGESGSGKSVTSLSVLRLVSAPGKITGGQINWKGKDLLTFSDREMRKIRGDEIAMIFSGADDFARPALHRRKSHRRSALFASGLERPRRARARAIEALEEVGIRDAASRVDAYPHQLSGGMRQRVMIAVALSCNPDLLIADEPTTALDVTVQAKILDLMRGLRDEKQMAIVLITHNMGIVAEMCDRVAVMHGGKIVGNGLIKRYFRQPAPSIYAAIVALDSHARQPAQNSARDGELAPDAAASQPIAVGRNRAGPYGQCVGGGGLK